jgi:predicted peroxiredoxin
MLGSGALAMDMELTLFFTMTGLNIIRKGGAEKIELPGAPKTIPEFLEIMREGGAKMIACSAAFPIIGIKEEDLIDGVECGGVAAFVSAAQEAGAVLTFC